MGARTNRSHGYGEHGVDEAYQIVRGDQLVLADVVARLSSESAPPTWRIAAGADGNADSSSDNNVFVRASRRTRRPLVAKADGDARRFLLLLTRLMREMRGIEGRKAVVLLSEGFYSDHVARELEDAAAAAAHSYSVVYSLDLNRRGPSPADAAPRGAAPAARRTEPHRAARHSGRRNRRAAVHRRGDQARSRVRVDRGRVAGLLHRRFRAGRCGERQSRYRRVTIRISRRGARVSARTGYTLELPDPSPAARRRQIDTAFAAPFAEQGLPVEFTTYALRGSAPGASSKIVLTVAAEIPTAPTRVRRHRRGLRGAAGAHGPRGRGRHRHAEAAGAGRSEAASVSGICRLQFEYGQVITSPASSCASLAAWWGPPIAVSTCATWKARTSRPAIWLSGRFSIQCRSVRTTAA